MINSYVVYNTNSGEITKHLTVSTIEDLILNVAEGESALLNGDGSCEESYVDIGSSPHAIQVKGDFSFELVKLAGGIDVDNIPEGTVIWMEDGSLSPESGSVSIRPDSAGSYTAYFSHIKYKDRQINFRVSS